MGVPVPRCTHAQGYRYLIFCVIIIITQGADGDGACGAMCAAGGRRPCRAAATSAATSACDRSTCGDSGHARGGHTMATGVSVQHHHASVRPTLGRKGCNHVVHSGNHVVHDRRGIGDRRALRGPRGRLVGVKGWPRGMCDCLVVICARGGAPTSSSCSSAASTCSSSCPGDRCWRPCCATPAHSRGTSGHPPSLAQSTRPRRP